MLSVQPQRSDRHNIFDAYRGRGNKVRAVLFYRQTDADVLGAVSRSGVSSDPHVSGIDVCGEIAGVYLENRRCVRRPTGGLDTEPGTSLSHGGRPVEGARAHVIDLNSLCSGLSGLRVRFTEVGDTFNDGPAGLPLPSRLPTAKFKLVL